MTIVVERGWPRRIEQCPTEWNDPDGFVHRCIKLTEHNGDHECDCEARSPRAVERHLIAEERWVIGKVVTTVTTTRTYDVYSDDWDFAYWDEEPNDEDITYVLTERGPRDVIEDVDWEWELTTSRTDNVETPNGW